ncbi:MAG: hypothetical protein A2849_01815 [Candidatus Taylorbacteria bacterium RIFCSPHIGHO2_01_FULL_51_15]|uniref:DUF7282 domain-containing protein n=1 Tax=Candidatus Taylorbacteria bacterium RIFCSPHIGHO2_01_FULL_51_15 TaxID=1802304 RepID=A0A1G2MBE2_9BACT|nr:MAG: hypothetical protein A2849_01815 [Candidatus Taylorbacteria bacterium RIFCSPHIGHO2_01_FULL_51_15]
MEPTTSNASGKIIAALLIGLLIGFVAGVFWQDRRAGSDKKETTSSQTTEEGGEEAASVATGESGNVKGNGSAALAGLKVEDQTAGGTATVANIDTSEIVWVAVREEKDGVVGNILGAQKVFVGKGQSVTVELLRPTLAGGTYLVVLYRDIGDPAFNYREDVVIEGMEGRFTAK